VRRWCDENRLDINSETGREAMDVSVRIVTCPRKDQFGLPGALAKEMASRVPLQVNPPDIVRLIRGLGFNERFGPPSKFIVDLELRPLLIVY
jgi:hypothetical protein